MKKWVVPILSVFFVLVLVYLSGPFHVFKVTVPREDLREKDSNGPDSEGREG